MPPRSFPATLFDYNGVIVDDEAVHLAAFRDALRPMGVGVSDAEYWERYIGMDDASAFRAILEGSSRSHDEREIASLVEAKRPLYARRARDELAAFPGAVECVKRRAAAGPVVVVSGALREEIDLGLRMLGIDELVSAVISAEDTAACKPDPEGYRKGVDALIRSLGGDLAIRAVVLEDSLAGVAAAKTAGLACVAVTHSHTAGALARAGADAVFGAIGDVTELALAELYARLHGARR